MNTKRKTGRKQFRAPREKSEFDEKLVDLARVTRVMAGGKRFRFRATVVVGNRKGKVGVGVAKGADVAQAIQKAAYQAKKKLVIIPIVKGTIPREMKAKYNAAVVLIRPAPNGRGINAGGAMRVICELAGIKDIIGKIISRSGNKLNTARATIKAFEMLPKVKVEKAEKTEKKPEQDQPKADQPGAGNKNPNENLPQSEEKKHAA
jgi:small subunit ribosomal protein S5